MLLADRDHLVMFGVILFDFRRGRQLAHEKLVSLWTGSEMEKKE